MRTVRPGAARVSLAVGLFLALMLTAAWAYWSPGAGSGGDGASGAATIAQGSTPVAVATGTSVAVSWAASNVIVGQPVTGYVVKRYEATTLAAQTILSNCAGTVTTLSCTESRVPSGSWRYSVTPKMGTFWTGPESLKSNAVTTADSSPPVNVISAAAVTGNAFESGVTVFYRGVAAGSFTLSNAVTDPDSAPASSATAALGGTSTGWTHVPSTVSAPAGGPYVSNVFSWTSATTSSPTEVVTGSSGAGSAAATALTYVNDSTAPSGGGVAYADGYQPYQSVSVTFDAGADSGSGIATHQLQRSLAPMTGGVCGTFSGFFNIGLGTTASPFTDTAVVNQNCYEYRYVVTDQLGNQSIATSTNVAKVDTSAGGPSLGSAGSFSVLGGSSVTSTGATVLSGDLGVSPGTSVVGFPPGLVGGAVHAGDSAAAGAQSALVSAYNDAAARAPTDTFSGDLGGLTIDAGVHHAAGAVTLTGTLTLDGQGDPNSVFIFQLGAAFATGAASQITLVNGATPSHVFWQVAGAVGAGASSVFAGTIMAAGAITMGDSAQLLGRALGYGTVTLSANTLRFGASAAPTVTITGGIAHETLDVSPTISGTTDAGTGQILTVTIGGQSLPATVQSDGSWSVTAAPLASGNYTAIATVRNLAGDEGTARQNITVSESFLGLTTPYSVLGGTAVSSSGATTVSGDLGVSPGTSVTGFPPGTVGGTIHNADTSAAAAQSQLVKNFNIIGGDPPTDSFAGEMGGLTMGPGLHHGSGAISLTGTLTLDAAGDPDAYFVFQLDSTLATAAASRVRLINGATAEHVGWQVNGAVGIGASSFFAGTIMASGAVTLGANAQLIGRALSFGAVTMSANTIRFGFPLPPTVTIDGGQAIDTYDLSPTISGTTNAGTGQTVTVAIGGQSLPTSVQSDGSWSVVSGPLTSGNYTAVATARNVAGDTGTARQNITVDEPILGAVASYSVLGGTAVSNSGATVVSGDLGVSPASSVSGFPPGSVGGTIHAGDSSAAAAQSKLQTDFNTIGQQPPDDGFAGEIGGLTFGPGVHYGSGAISLTGTVTLDAGGDPNAYFIFQLDSALATAAASHVTLINGAQAANVFWQVNGAVGMGASSFFSGTVMASGAITLGASAQLIGRALSFDTVTMSSNTIRFTTALPPTVSINGGTSAVAITPTPTITGTTTAGVGRIVTVRLEDQTLTTTVQSDSSWSVTAAALAGGPHQVVAAATDAAGNAGSATQTLTVELNPAPPDLGAVSTYSVFGQTGVSNSGSTALSGDLGSSAAGGIAGFPPGTFGGSMHAGDSAATAAQTALTTAYNDAAARTPTDSIAGEIGGLTFNDGVHAAAAAISLTGTVTLDGRGDPNAVFIFQINAAMATAAASHVVLINGAQASHVFWQVSGAFGTGASAVFVGTVMAAGAITLGAGASLAGRALSYGLVTLSTNSITTS